ncbi:MAG TPA: BamA/TamA family outer membrane protein [Chitinophagaceae bacterium]|nr:BamA/TamA family outer membrane protein [Chitinophagaceae bacterium]
MIIKYGRNIGFYQLALLIFLLLLSSCFLPTKVKKYQKDKPFVFSNKIILKVEALSAAQKADLKLRISAQLDDSMKVRVLDRAILPRLIKSPPAFDTASLNKSINNIKILMNNLGYFRAGISAVYKIDSSKLYTSKNQYRVTTTFTVDAKRNTVMDSISYLLPTTELEKITNETLDKALLKKGEPFTVEKISAEINRLLNIYRNEGYYKISRDDIFALVDSVNKALLNPNLSDFERILLLTQLKNKRPTINVQLLTKPSPDSNKYRRYYIGDITVFPDFSGLTGGEPLKTKFSKDSNIIIQYNKDKYHSSFISNNIFLKKGELYREDDYIKTLNNLSQLGTWQIVNIFSKDTMLNDSLPVVDFLITLTPTKRLGFSINLESSFSTNVAAATGNGNILGFLGNISFTDRNVVKEGARITHTIRGGIEYDLLNNGSQNSRELGYSNNFSIPKFMPPLKFLLPKNTLSKNSTINFNISSLNRIGFFNLASFNLGFGYDWKKKANTSTFWKPLNIDYSNLFNASDTFNKARESNVFLRNSFQTSLVIGQIFGYVIELPNKKRPNRITTIRVNLEESGLIAGTLKRAIGSKNFLNNLREFLKADVEYKYIINLKKSAWVFRTFVAVGSPIRGDSGLPFFKQYFGGGPNSMRAWPIRTLGQGGAPYPIYSPGVNRFNDRVGDIQLEANAEYRYNIVQIIPNVVALKGALFMDAGNIWAIKKDKTITSGEDPKYFQFKNLYKQLAVGIGTGFRFDFNYFLIRFDFGFRFKKPDVSKNNGWQIPDINFRNVFGSAGKEWRYNNYNFTFGINYAF